MPQVDLPALVDRVAAIPLVVMKQVAGHGMPPFASVQLDLNAPKT